MTIEPAKALTEAAMQVAVVLDLSGEELAQAINVQNKRLSP